MPVLYHEGRYHPQALDLATLFPLVGLANAAVARHEGVLAGIPNPDILLSPLTSRKLSFPARSKALKSRLAKSSNLKRRANLIGRANRHDLGK